MLIDLPLEMTSLLSTMLNTILAGNQWLDWMSPMFAAEPTALERWSGWLYNITLVALGLGFVIFVHELGHFLAAKAFGVKCEKFYIGFDVPIKIGPIRLPAKLMHFQWGETEYGIGIIPLGGYVKMLGQDDDPRRAEEEAKRIRSQNPNAGNDDPNRVVLDPRSFPAKSVGARMVIISAGVIMNIIFGILMAALAFRGGVPYEPAVIGEVLPGDPAWKNGLQPGDQIVRVNSLADKELSFRDMFMTVLFQGLRDPKGDLSIDVERDGSIINKKFIGTTSHSDPKKGITHLTLGVRSSATTKVPSDHPVDKSVYLGFKDPSRWIPKLQKGDVIIGIDGQPLPISDHSHLPMRYSLDQKMHPKVAETITLQVERPSTTEGSKEALDVEVAPVPMKGLGLRFHPGPVTSVLADSPASKAGVQAGDIPVSWNGKPIEDAFTLPLLVAAEHGKKGTVELERADKSRVRLEWDIPNEFILSRSEGTLSPTGLELPGSGLVFAPSDVVSNVVANTAAAKSGIAAGDTVKQFAFDASAKEDQEYVEQVISFGAKTLFAETPLDPSHNIQYFHNLVQLLRCEMPVSITYERDGKVSKAKVEVTEEKEWFSPDRGLALESLKFSHQTDSTVTALQMGCREIWRRGGNVVEFLELLIRGKMPFKVVGGPGMIAVEATDAASKGTGQLLMFLTMLSANLAIINFLPIPALDGGHMAFLTAEAVMGRPVNEEWQMKLTMAGVIGLLCLMGAVIINDSINISRWFGG